MRYFGYFFLDSEKDIIVDLYEEADHLYYELKTPNHRTGNLITNLADLCHLPVSYDENGLKIIKGEIPCYINAENERMFIFRLSNTKVANIYPDGRIELKASIPSVSKTLMSQTKDYRLDEQRTIIKTYIFEDCKFHSDLHTHMNANLHPDILIALGIRHQIRYPLYYVQKLGLSLSDVQQEAIMERRKQTEALFADSRLTGKYLQRKIDDNTFINFADLILNNLEDAEYNIPKIRASLSIMKDGQAVFTNLEKVYLYRYVFTKGIESEEKIDTDNYIAIPDEDIVRYLRQMYADEHSSAYENNSLLQNKLLWIARSYQRTGISYVEISDTSLVKGKEAIPYLKAISDIMPAIYSETGVRIRFLAAMRRIPLTIIRDQINSRDYFRENLETLWAISDNPYVAGCDFVGEEINSIRELRSVLHEVVKIAEQNIGFTIRVHAGENDSLKHNVSDSIDCLLEAAEDPANLHIRIGHGLYTSNLNSPSGQHLIDTIKNNHIVLEFQISSNVRLNNLSSLRTHPLKKYLNRDIPCVQGTDGASIYGTNSIDEQLSLEKLLGLSHSDLIKMKETETRIINEETEIFRKKEEALREKLSDISFEDYYLNRLQEAEARKIRISSEVRYDSFSELHDKIHPVPDNKVPVIIAGGSFNTESRKTRMHKDAREFIDELINHLDPDKVFFVIGNSFSGYEQYLAENARGFEIYSYVPAVINRRERSRLISKAVSYRISTEIKAMGLYKSINYEIFERMPSITIALDGNSPCANLIQEARNGKARGTIFIYEGASLLSAKARLLRGYVTTFKKFEDIAAQLEPYMRKDGD